MKQQLLLLALACALSVGASHAQTEAKKPREGVAPPVDSRNAGGKKNEDKAKAAFSGTGGIRGAIDSHADRWLVLPQEAGEFGGEAGYNEPPILRPRAIQPGIEILKPEVQPGSKLQSPFPIQVNFRGMSDAPIDPSTFKVFYGALKVDITQRIAGHVKVTPQGFTLDKAQIPKGKHRLTLQVQDEKQRVAERELRIEVE
jgi:hypothetical protein